MRKLSLSLTPWLDTNQKFTSCSNDKRRRVNGIDGENIFIPQEIVKNMKLTYFENNFFSFSDTASKLKMQMHKIHKNMVFLQCVGF